ncbi:MAG TPA: OmpH family outer membrane protein [Chitinophagaceae bacterium]|nr:OmpH family outer membrane protein [Chitinophagaceae bacterium]
MKKIVFPVFAGIFLLIAGTNSNAQTLRAGVFDIDLMVQAMPGYRLVDSLVQIYEVDSLGAELEFLKWEYQRLDSTYKLDSAAVAQGKKTQAQLNFLIDQRRETGLKLVYWQQYAQNKSNNKRGQLAQPLYQVVINAYKKILDKKKYMLVLKPQTYEAGFAIDNIFLSVARELKLSELPQQLLNIGDDPDVTAKPPTKPTTPGNKPKTN